MCDTLEKWFFKLFPSQPKKPETPEGEWMRCMSFITCIVHNGMFVLCLALVGFGAMIFNFLQAVWIYSVYLTLREREMIVYLILLLGQIAQAFCYLFISDEDTTLAAFQQGGIISCLVVCGILLVVNGRALYAFHEAGGLHGKAVNKPLLQEDPTDLVADSDKKKGKKNAEATEDPEKAISKAETKKK